MALPTYEVPPVSLPLGKELTADEFYLLARQYEGGQLERLADGTIVTLPPMGLDASSLAAELIALLVAWNRGQATRGKVFGADGGFILPSGAVRLPDVSWLSRDKWAALPKAQQERYAQVVPDFVIEVLSPNDNRTACYRKMTEYMEAGVRLAWLLDPDPGQVRIYRANGSIEIHDNWNLTLTGEDVLPGFTVALNDLVNQ